MPSSFTSVERHLMLNVWTTYAISEMFRTALRGAICRWSQRNSQALELLWTQVAEEKGKTINVLHICEYVPLLLALLTWWICWFPTQSGHVLSTYMAELRAIVSSSWTWGFCSEIFCGYSKITSTKRQNIFMNLLLGLGYIMSPKKISIWGT